MVSEKILVGSALGIHLRPAGAMCDTAVKFDSHITFTFKNKVVNAKSVISILASGVGCGDEITLIAEGPDEEEALKAVSESFRKLYRTNINQERGKGYGLYGNLQSMV